MITLEQWKTLRKGSILLTKTGKECEVIRVVGRDVEFYSVYGRRGRVFRGYGDVRKTWSIKQ